MTLSELKQVIAWAEEGKLQYKDPYGKWQEYPTKAFPDWSFTSTELFSRYRRTPEPKYRPWKPKEVPVGAIIAFGDGQVCTILAMHEDADDQSHIHFYGINDAIQRYPTRLLHQYKYSLDNGKTWHPCGVVE